MPPVIQDLLNQLSGYPPWMVYTGLAIAIVLLVYLAFKVLKFAIYTAIVVLALCAVAYAVWLLFFQAT